MLAKLLEYLSRKFILSLLAMAGTFGLAWYGKDVLAWTTGITAILAFYNGSNVYQEYIARRYKGDNKES